MRKAPLALLLPALLLAGCVSRPPPAPPTATAPVTQAPPASDAPWDQMVKVGQPYQVNGVWYHPADDRRYEETGLASWYGPGFHGAMTANGETFDQDAVSAAHKTLPMPSYVEVENLENRRRLVVRVNDRGPFVDSRIIDLSRRSAELLGMAGPGLARVRVRRIAPSADEVAALRPSHTPTPLATPPVAAVALAAPPLPPTPAAPAARAPDATPVAPPAAPPYSPALRAAPPPANIAPAPAPVLVPAPAPSPARPPADIAPSTAPGGVRPPANIAPNPTEAVRPPANIAPAPAPARNSPPANIAPPLAPVPREGTAPAPAETAPLPAPATVDNAPSPAAPVMLAAATLPPTPFDRNPERLPDVAEEPVAEAAGMILPEAERIETVSIPAPEIAPREPGAMPPGSILIQVAAVADKARATRLAGNLSKIGPVRIETTPEGLHRVRLGPFPSREAAATALSRVRAAGYQQAWIVSTPPTS